MVCEYCNNHHNGLYGSGRFCNSKCARGFSTKNKRIEINKKVSIKAKNNKPSLHVKEKIKESLKKFHKENPNFNKLTRPKKYIISKCQYCNGDIKHVSYKSRKYHNECWKKCSGGFRKNSTIVHKYTYNGIKLDSGAEFQFANFLEINNVKWIKNQTYFIEYIGVDCKKHKYYPDFYLSEFDIWVEIKGKRYANLDPNFNIKINLIQRYILIYSTELKNLTVNKLFLSINKFL